MTALVTNIALMTMEEADLSDALRLLEQAEKLADVQIAQYYTKPTIARISSTLSGAAKLARSSWANLRGNDKTQFQNSNNNKVDNKADKETPIQNGEVRALIIRAEACLLSSMLLVLDENVVGYVKAGLKLRRTWKTYNNVWSDLKKRNIPDGGGLLDKHTLGGVQFGIGAIHSCFSML